MENSDNYVGYKIKLYPTPEQIKIFNQYFGVSRYVYNLGIDIHHDHYQKVKDDDNIEFKSMSFYELNKEFNRLKKEEKYEWLTKYNGACLTLVLRDVITAYKRFYKKICNYPKYKSKKKYNHRMFPVRPDRLTINYDTVRIPSIGEVYCDNHNHPEIIGNGYEKIKNNIYKHYYDARVTFDGYSYWLGVELKISHEERNEPNSFKRFKNNDLWQHKEYSEAIGIDLGCKHNNWIVDSTGTRISRPDTSKEEKQVAKYQRKLAIKQRVNREKRTNSTLAGNMLEEPNYTRKQQYTKNEEKILKKLNKAYHRITNKKKAVIHDYACSIIEKKPKAIVLEDLSIKDMLINRSEDISYVYRRRHNKMIYDSMLYVVREIIEEKATGNGIPVLFADKEYPSTQLCSCCGHRQKIGPIKVYKCPVCGTKIDRDYNSAINLSYIADNSFNQYQMIV